MSKPKLRIKKLIAPAKVVEKLRANREAYDAATAGLSIRPIWTQNEVWNEPTFSNWVDAMLKTVPTPSKAYLAGLEGGLTIEWYEE